MSQTQRCGLLDQTNWRAWTYWNGGHKLVSCVPSMPQAGINVVAPVGWPITLEHQYRKQNVFGLG